MIGKKSVMFFGLFLMAYSAGAQDSAYRELYVDPTGYRFPVLISHRVGSYFGLNYYYEIINAKNEKIVAPEKIKPSRYGKVVGVEERFITDYDGLDNLYNPYMLKIAWNCRYADVLYPDGDYWLKIYATKGGIRNIEKPFYIYKITLDREPNSFEIELATEAVSKNDQGVLFVRAVDKNNRRRLVQANRWDVKIYNEAYTEIIQSERFEASGENADISFQYGWYDFTQINQTGTYKYKIMITNMDRAGNTFSAEKDFSIVYSPVYSPDKAARYESIIALLRKRLEESERDSPNTAVSANNYAPLYKDRFKMNLNIWGSLAEIQGLYDGTDKLFKFDFAYSGILENNSVKSIEIGIYDEKGKRIKTINDADTHSVFWNGKDNDNKFILTSDTTYQFRFTFKNKENKTVTANNSITTTLITENRENDELFVLLPGLYFPGFGSNIFKTDVFLNDNMEVIWKIAELLTRYLNDYEYVIIKGYSNYTTYPSNRKPTAADRRRMNNEKPSLDNYAKRRAEVIKDILVLFKIPADKIRIEGVGPVMDVDPNGSERHKNRRVEFYLKERI